MKSLSLSAGRTIPDCLFSSYCLLLSVLYCSATLMLGNRAAKGLLVRSFCSAITPVIKENKIWVCGKFSKISNTFLFLFSNKMLVFRAGIHKMLIRIAKQGGDPDQTASSEAV